MKHDPDLLRAARALIDFHGATAAAIAERRARALPDEGPDSAAGAWLRLAQTVKQMQGRQAAMRA